MMSTKKLGNAKRTKGLWMANYSGAGEEKRRFKGLKWSSLNISNREANTGVCYHLHEPNYCKNKAFFRLSATLYLARIYVADFTETMLLNMCVYESMTRQDEGVHNYVMLMDELINTKEDVELLMDGKNPIITENRLGDNKHVVGIFTNPVQNLPFVEGNSFESYALVRDEMIAWYNNPWRRQMVQFIDSYRVAPWLLLSLLAAISLLILTVLQTVYTIWAFYKT
ncbi:hypothetical protein R1sor_011426 [Riccia sorocarpa]|uniref:Uncharacterized protein n=1 Tax=Riccia sorocarpa TaxID=122646 RepID=A0ABD3I0T6_9MARC